MPWIDPWGNQHHQLPERIRLADFSTRTAHDATPAAAIEGGWLWEELTEQIPEPIGDTIGYTITGA